MLQDESRHGRTIEYDVRPTTLTVYIFTFHQTRVVNMKSQKMFHLLYVYIDIHINTITANLNPKCLDINSFTHLISTSQIGQCNYPSPA